MRDGTAFSRPSSPAQAPAGRARTRARDTEPERLVLSDRDTDIVGWVRVLNHVTYRQLRILRFHKNKSDTPLERRLKFLVSNNYLQLQEQPATAGGPPRNIYRLGPAGHALFSRGRFVPKRDNVEHSLQVGNRVCELYQLDRAGVLKIVSMEFEPDTHVWVGTAHIRPDLYVQLEMPGVGVLPICVEVEISPKNYAKVTRKITAYCDARRQFSDVDVVRWPEFPYVLIAAVDDYKARELEKRVQRLPNRMDRAIFRFTTFKEFPHYFDADRDE